jgi:hypothetical protein
MTLFSRISAIGLLAALGLGTAACTEDGYGYSGVSLGYASPGYYGDYDGYGYPGYGGYGSSYFGWYGDYYYPGSGYYVYDRYRRPHRWNDGQRRYWETRRNNWSGDRGAIRDNWNGFGNRGDRRDWNRGERRDWNGNDGRAWNRGDGRTWNRGEGRTLNREGGRTWNRGDGSTRSRGDGRRSRRD